MKKHAIRVFSPHPTHTILRQNRAVFPFLACVRLGSTTKGSLPYAVEINTVEAIRNSASKLLMKQKFSEGGVKTALWSVLQQFIESPMFEFPIVVKNIFGSRGTGNYLINSPEQLNSWKEGRKLENYICEKFYNYSKEYRLHVTKDGCFYTCRKMLKSDIPKDKRWYRNDSNSVWVMEENPLFDKPSNWETIVSECVKALNAVGLDVGAFDVKVQSMKNKETKQDKQPDFIVIESNSAPSFGEITAKKYLEILPSLIETKFKNQK